jgi:hypothetical protein
MKNALNEAIKRKRQGLVVEINLGGNEMDEARSKDLAPPTEMYHEEGRETPEMEAKSHDENFLKEALLEKKTALGAGAINDEQAPGVTTENPQLTPEDVFGKDQMIGKKPAGNLRAKVMAAGRK